MVHGEVGGGVVGQEGCVSRCNKYHVGQGKCGGRVL